MKAFVAIGSSQKQPAPGVWRAIDGELVWILQNEGPCAECGCRWSVVGLATGKVAPVFTIADRADLAPEEFRQHLVRAWRQKGWSLPKDERAPLRSLAKMHLDVAARFDVGERLSFRRGKLQVNAADVA